jgi:NAD(P)-dependent dehydrogenase (short-subunit alcohol dehydrogenase family)
MECMMQRLAGKVILVAGGGGIGDELARRYASEGARVVLGDIDFDRASAVAEDIRGAGNEATAAHLDGADEQSIAAAVTLAGETYGGLDGLHVNFASFSALQDDTNVLEVPLEIFDETIRVDLRGYFLCTRLALPAILARGGGTILYTSSGGAYVGYPTRVSYGMSKSGVHALMRHVSSRYGAQGVRSNVIAPGVIKHERWPDWSSVKAGENMGHIKSRFGRPDDIASISALLMSEEGSFITAQVISVDGGLTMRA